MNDNKSLLDTINSGFDIILNLESEPKKIEIEIDLGTVLEQNKVTESVEITITEPVVEEPEKVDIELVQDANPKSTNLDSVIESVDTGFDSTNSVVKECPKPQFKTPLFKENYLSEFKSETEKELARYNLGIYSKKEIDDVVEKIIKNNDFATKSEVNAMLSNLDFTSSTFVSQVNYQIPNTLFK